VVGRQSLVVRNSSFANGQANPLEFANDQRPVTNDQLYPIPSSSGDSSGVPQRRQMTAEQSPQVRGSLTSTAQTGQYNPAAGFWTSGVVFGVMFMGLSYEHGTVTQFSAAFVLYLSAHA
jgi:hypothetical protein